MTAKSVAWMIALAAVLTTSQAGVGAESWRAVEQPELKQALEKAPLLRTESLGEPARGVNTWEHWAVPNPDGKTWDELQVYFKEYYGPTWLYAIDLGTGEVTKQRLPDHRQFYLSGRALGLDGKYYIYDVRQQAISRQIVPLPKARTTALIAEVVPGRLLGLTVDGVEPGRPGHGVLYGLDMASGEVLFRKTLPWPEGGLQLHFIVADIATLRDAVKHPERHGDLLVRVAGFSEYFVRLLPEVQQEIIRRAQSGADE